MTSFYSIIAKQKTARKCTRCHLREFKKKISCGACPQTPLHPVGLRPQICGLPPPPIFHKHPFRPPLQHFLNEGLMYIACMYTQKLQHLPCQRCTSSEPHSVLCTSTSPKLWLQWLPFAKHAKSNNIHVANGSTDNIDSVNGIGNLLRDQYTTVHSMADRPCWPMMGCLSGALLKPM